MLAAQAAYGPHGLARFAAADVALGRRLFRSLPEDRFDQDVVTLPDGAVLVADVRLDNRSEVASELGLENAQAARLSDASLLAAAWCRWRDGCFNRLLGDYAFAVWDAPGRQLLLARDPYGRRPLHVHRSRRLVAFASMPMGLHALTEVPVAPDLEHLAAFLALRPERGARTFFQDVECVEPGTVLTLRPEGSLSRRHYQPGRVAPAKAGVRELVEGLREHLTRSVRAQLRGAERDVGAHLSSGWDSAAVTATAARCIGETGGRVTAFTAVPVAGFDASAPPRRHADESSGAAEVCAMYPNIEHVLVARGRSPLEDLDRDIAFNGRPSLNACNHSWLNDINRAARNRGIRVMLTGDFGNLGLTEDGLDGFAELMDGGQWSAWWNLGQAAVTAGELRWRGVLAASFEHRLPMGTRQWLRRWFGHARADARRHSVLRSTHWPTVERNNVRRSMNRAIDRLNVMTHFDLSLYAKGALASFGVVLRDPLVDRRLMEFCQSIPRAQLTTGGRPRGLARLALMDRLPVGLLDARSRGYQAADWHVGLSADRDRLAQDVERLAALAPAAELLDVDRLRALVHDWPTGGWNGDEVIDEYRYALIRGVAAGRFLINTLRVNE